MEPVIRTVYGTALQAAQLLGLEYKVEQYTTLNERFNVLKNEQLPVNTYPKLQYYTIGTNGIIIVPGVNNKVRTQQVQHRSTDACTYGPIPFALRLTTNDLTVTERSKYAMRVTETHNGESYFAYYLKRLDTSQVTVKMENKSVSNSQITTTPFIPDSSNLSPTPPNISNAGVNVVSSDFVSSSAQSTIVLTEQECTEIINAATIIYGSEDYAIISEIGLCTGLDKVIAIQGGGNFREAIGVQIMAHINTLHPLQTSRGGITSSFEIGSDPLLLIP